MKSYEQLPEGYGLLYGIDLQKDKRLALLVNLLSLGIAVLLTVPAAILVPLSTLFRNGEGDLSIGKVAVTMVLTVLYVVLHELVHGVAMKLCGTKRVKYGFTGMYAYAGSDDYYAKGAYLFIALAPVVLWGVVLAIAAPLVSRDWFWVVYFVQIMNLSGAAGDFYVTAKFSRLTGDVLIRDYGVGMQIYGKS